MSTIADDIQAAGSDTRPPMLDRTDYESWSQRIRLYCRGKENGENILRSIDEGPFQMGTTRDIIPPPKMERSPMELTDLTPITILLKLRKDDMMQIFVLLTL